MSGIFQKERKHTHTHIQFGWGTSEVGHRTFFGWPVGQSYLSMAEAPIDFSGDWLQDIGTNKTSQGSAKIKGDREQCLFFFHPPMNMIPYLYI